jgi:hypothetical protein
VSKATDFPLWEDCPFRELVPEGVVIRHGTKFGRKLLILSEETNGRSTKHVAAVIDFGYEAPVINMTEANAAEWVPTLVELLASR